MPRTASRAQKPPAVTAATAAVRIERMPLERIMRLIAAINRGERVSAASFAPEFGVTPLTIRRDVAMMSDQLKMPIAWDRVRKTYYFTRPCECVPLLRLNDREALMLAIVGRVVASWGAVPFGRELAAILQKIADVLGGDIAATSAAMDRVLSLPAIEAGPELDHLLPVLEAARARRPLALEYAGAHAARPEKRVVHPLHVRHDRKHWQLLAYVPAWSRVCTLRLTRIRKLTTLQTTFEPPLQWNATRRVEGSMGGFSSDKEHEIRLALDAHAAFYAREDPWHASQTLHELPDGRTELRLRLNNLEDAEFTALHWGEHVEVLAPADLREQVWKSLRSALARYEGGAGHESKPMP